jgi:hypothetical protein
MASPHVSADRLSDYELELRAEEQRQRLGRDVANLRQSMREELNVRGRLEDGIHAEPGIFYAVAAGAALFAGYTFARYIKHS